MRLISTLELSAVHLSRVSHCLTRPSSPPLQTTPGASPATASLLTLPWCPITVLVTAPASRSARHTRQSPAPETSWPSSLPGSQTTLKMLPSCEVSTLCTRLPLTPSHTMMVLSSLPLASKVPAVFH